MAPRSLRCPRCSTVISVQDGQAPVCPTCGFTGPAPAPAAPASPQSGPAMAGPPPQAATPSLQPMSYPAPAAGWPAAGQTDGLSVAAMVLGICGVLGPFLGLLSAVLGLVLGIVALGHYRTNPGLKGHGMAVAGIVLGAIFIAIWLLVLIVIGSIINAGLHGFR